MIWWCATELSAYKKASEGKHTLAHNLQDNFVHCNLHSMRKHNSNLQGNAPLAVFV